jgi:phosphoglycerate kinase
MWKKQTIRDINVKGKVVLLRTDYNVPLDERGKITEDYRIRASLPTIDYLLEHGAKRIVIISHLGRPEGVDESLSLAPVAKRLEKLLGQPVYFARETTDLPDTRVIMLENLRFSPKEEKRTAAFAKDLVKATKAQIFVQDAFGAVHRAHTSIVEIPKLLPSVAGLLLEREVDEITKAMKRPTRPLLAIIGGSKVKDKQPLIDLFAKTANMVALGGRLGLGFENAAPNITIPLDYRYGRDGEPYDIGDISAATIVDMVKGAGTVIWNGVVGKVEDKEFAESSQKVAEAIGKSGATSLILGGDTASFVIEMANREKSLEYSLVSTGGGSALELILGKKLPGIEALPNRVGGGR